VRSQNIFIIFHIFYYHFRNIVPHDFAHYVTRLWVSFFVRRTNSSWISQKWRKGVWGGSIAEIDDEDFVEDAVT